LALVETGDEVTIEADTRTLDLNVPDAVMAERRERRGEPPLMKARGYLSIYQRSVQPMSTGAVLVEND
jgi:dihydroxy-acid dehydratase